MKWLLIPISGFLFYLTAIMPAFYFALYRNEGALHFPKRLRLLALLAAFTNVMLMVTDFPAWIRSLSSYLATFDWVAGAASVLVFVRDPRTVGQLSTCLMISSNIANILLLIAIFGHASEQTEPGAPVSEPLREMTKAAVILGGFVVVVVLLGLVLTPYNFYTLRNSALQIGRMPPALGGMLLSQARTVLVQACLFAAPYIVYRSLPEQAQSPVAVQSAPELIEGGG